MASIEPGVIKPAETALVKVIGEPPSAGEKAVQVEVGANEMPPRVLVMTLTMIGHATPPFVVSHNGPIRLDPAATGPGPETLRVVTREFRSRPPWLAAASSGDADVEIDGGVARETPLGPDVVIREYEYEVKMRRVPPPGHYSGNLTSGDDAGASRASLTVPYHADVPRPVEPSPSRLYATVERGEHWPRWSVTLTADRGDFDLDARPAATAELPLEVRRTRRQGRRNTFEVVGSDAAPHSFSGTLLFETNHPGAPEVRIPVSVRLVGEE